MPAKTPEPKGLPPLFSNDSWKRPEAPAKPARDDRFSGPVTPASFRAFLGADRLEKWTAHAIGCGADFTALLTAAGKLANDAKTTEPHLRHYDAKGHLRVLLSDALRACRATSPNPSAPLPVLY